MCIGQLECTVFLAQSIEVLGWVLLCHPSICAGNLFGSTIAPEEVVKRDFDLFVAGNLCIDESLLFLKPLIEYLGVHGCDFGPSAWHVRVGLGCGVLWGKLWRCYYTRNINTRRFD